MRREGGLVVLFFFTVLELLGKLFVIELLGVVGQRYILKEIFDLDRGISLNEPVEVTDKSSFQARSPTSSLVYRSPMDVKSSLSFSVSI